MRFARGDVRGSSFHTKSIKDLRIGATMLCSGRHAKNQLLRNFRCCSIFDFFNNIGAKRKLASVRPAAVVVRFKLAMNQVMPKIEKISQVGVALEG